ncbi:WhiB family transcriptional regulator [Streptomyces sp. NPDC002573]|uniref:WhiB family transcriptional regulator n=1 Tax=Streptomyces sp. NPDC002573 TaxID=3364651 RepID=UPI003674921B
MSNYTGSVPDTTKRKPDWRTSAACRGLGDAMFPDSNKNAIEAAKALCRSCPVVNTCLQFALNEGIPHGVFGGLTEKERAGLRRRINAGRITPENAAKSAAKARQPHKERTLRSIFDDNTVRVIDGHLKWTASPQVNFKGRVYSVRQIAFILDRGHYPEGKVLTGCSNKGCVLPAHLADYAERTRCGTRGGYQRHLANSEPIDDACRQANTDADNQLRRTGTTLKLAG